MLVLSRKIGEQLVIDNRIVVRVVQINGNRVRIGIEAPADVNIRRDELPTPVWVEVPTENTAS